MLLNDAEIRRYATCPAFFTGGKPLLDPFSEGQQEGEVISFGLSHAGYDLRLGPELWVFKNTRNHVLNPKAFKRAEKAGIDAFREYLSEIFDIVKPRTIDGFDNAFILPQGPCYALGFSLEYICLPRHLKGRCVGKSTLARCGIGINTTPLEPEWEGHLTVEIAIHSNCPAMIFAYEGIAQLEFEHMVAPAEKSYKDKSGKYQGQGAQPVPARIKG